MTSVKILKSIPLFADLDDHTSEVISGITTIQTYETRDIIITEAQASSIFFIILSGKVKVCSSSTNGKEVILKILSSGDFFGDIFKSDASDKYLTVTALSEVELLLIQGSHFHKFLLGHPRVSIGLLQELAKRIRSLEFRILFLSHATATGKIAAVVQQIAEKDGQLIKGKMIIEKFPNCSQIAHFVGITRETVSRVLHRLESKKLIELGISRLTISDYKKFSEIFDLSAIQIDTDSLSHLYAGFPGWSRKGKRSAITVRSRLKKIPMEYSYKNNSKVKIRN
ncbi:Crp/Fnr family transcriptional regulator [bacterium]|nr:Crp/Fnr family transcriptional regulator [bacterium]